MDKPHSEDIDFILPWIQKQADTTFLYIQIVNTLLSVFYVICLLGSTGVNFPEARSFWLGLPASLAASIEKDYVIVLAALNVLTSVYIGWTGHLSLGLHITFCLIAFSRGTFSCSLICFTALYIIGLVLKRAFANHLAVYAESILRLNRIHENSLYLLDPAE
jgi:hypothetical protein